VGIEGLDYRIIQIPLTQGLKTKDDPRAMQAPGLSICADARFDDLGGIQPRYPFTALSSNIFGGGTLSSVRRLEVVNDELLLFTSDSLYSWNAQLSAWVLKGTHLAVKVDETTTFATPGDQITGDRAELSGTVVFAWTEGTQVYAAALDKTTGSVLVAPTAVSTAIGRPRLVALATKILFFVESTATEITVRAIDPAAPGTAIAGAGTVVLTTNANLYYDVVKAGSQDLCVGAIRRVVTTSYTVFTCTPALTVTTSTKARTCDGPIAVATISDGTQTQIVRANGTNIQGDLLTTSSLADVFTAQAIGTVGGSPVNQIALAFASTAASVFWSHLETTGVGSATFATKTNTVTTANVVGTQSVLVLRVGVASRAFARGASVFVWLVFAEQSANFGTGTALGIRGQLQNTYLLYRSDGHITGKAVFQLAGGYSPATGHLPGVTTTSASGDDWAWCGAVQRKIILGGTEHTGYAARSLSDITFSFDSNEARRCAQIGETLYISGSIPLQYDGYQLTEVGFLNYPWAFATQDSGVAGNVAAGTYAWKSTWKWTNGRGETERSTTATGESLTLALAHFVILTLKYLYSTRKAAPRPPTVEVWRTAATAGEGSSYYLITGQDPTVTTGDNPYVPNDSTTTGTTINDNFADSTLTTKEQNPENGNVLESLAPLGATIIIATDTRLFLVGLAGDSDGVWYSRQRNVGEIASFHDSLRVAVPRPGGAITAAAFLNETLVVFRQRAIYALPGQGFDNTGGGQNFGPANRLASDVGAVSAESVALTPQGLIFKSSKGWYLLDHGWNTRYIGADVAKYDGDTVNAVHVVEAYHQIRCVTNARILVFDYLTSEWSAWSISDAVHACLWNGTYYYLSSGSNAPMQEQTTFAAGVNYGLDVELGFVKPADLQGAVRIDKILILGEYRGACSLRIRTAFDYQQDGAGNWVYTDDIYWSPSPTTIGSALQVARGTTRGRCEAIKIRITAASTAKDGSPPTTEAIKLTGIALKVGFRKTPYKRLPAAQKT